MLYDFEVSQLKALLFLRQLQTYYMSRMSFWLINSIFFSMFFCPARLTSGNHKLTRIKVWGGAETSKLMPLPQGCRWTRWSSSGSFPSKCCWRLCAMIQITISIIYLWAKIFLLLTTCIDSLVLLSVLHISKGYPPHTWHGFTWHKPKTGTFSSALLLEYWTHE